MITKVYLKKLTDDEKIVNSSLLSPLFKTNRDLKASDLFCLSFLILGEKKMHHLHFVFNIKFDTFVTTSSSRIKNKRAYKDLADFIYITHAFKKENQILSFNIRKQKISHIFYKIEEELNRVGNMDFFDFLDMLDDLKISSKSNYDDLPIHHLPILERISTKITNGVSERLGFDFRAAAFVKRSSLRVRPGVLTLGVTVKRVVL